MKVKSIKILAMAAAVFTAVGFVGCGGSSDATALKGEIKVDGSSTVAPITEAMAEEFNIENKDVKIPVGISGTGGGFKRFVTGETDIQDASRPIKSEEEKKAEKNGVSYTQLNVALDGVVVAVSKDNDFVDSLSVEELKKMWEPGSTIKTWKDLRSEWPETPIKFYTPGPDSGTFEFFTEAIVGKSKAMRNDVNPSEDDNVLVQGVAGDKSAIGFFGFAYYEENKDKLKAIKIEDEGKTVEPTFDTIKDGTYKPLSRPIFIYVNNKSLERPEVKAFVDFYLENAQAIVPEIGYIPLGDEAYAKELEKINKE